MISTLISTYTYKLLIVHCTEPQHILSDVLRTSLEQLHLVLNYVK